MIILIDYVHAASTIFKIIDTIPHLVGTKDEPHHSSIPSSADKIYLMTNKIIKYNGTIVAWDYEADTDSGDVYFQVDKTPLNTQKRFSLKLFSSTILSFSIFNT